MSVIRERTAWYLSFILGPQVWFPALILLFLFSTKLPQQQIFLLLPILLFFQIIVPSVALYWFIRTKRIADWDIRKREERYTILPIFMLSTFVAVVIAYFWSNQLFFKLSFILWFTALVGVTITYKWKISLHLILNTAAVIMVNFLFGWKLPLLYFLIPLVAWARYTNKHHTFFQIVGGIAVGATIVLLSFRYFRYL